MSGLLFEMRPQLGRFVAARGCEASEVEDILQDLFLKVGELRSGPIANPRAYLFQMASNLVMDVRRGRKRQERRDDSWARANFGHALEADPQPDPASVAEARELLHKVQAAIDAMPPRTAEILKLYRLEGVSQKDIAYRIGVSLSSVEKHLQSAYRALHELRRSWAATEAERADG